MNVTDEQAQSAFAGNMNELMSKLGITQADLARLSGESEARISFYRNEKRAPSIGVATRIAESLGSTIDSMLKPIKSTVKKRTRKKVAKTS